MVWDDQRLIVNGEDWTHFDHEYNSESDVISTADMNLKANKSPFGEIDPTVTKEINELGLDGKGWTNSHGQVPTPRTYEEVWQVKKESDRLYSQQQLKTQRQFRDNYMDDLQFQREFNAFDFGNNFEDRHKS